MTVAGLAPAMVVIGAAFVAVMGAAMVVLGMGAAVLLGGAIDGLLPISESNGGRPIPPLRANISLILGCVARAPVHSLLVLGF